MSRGEGRGGQMENQRSIKKCGIGDKEMEKRRLVKGGQIGMPEFGR